MEKWSHREVRRTVSIFNSFVMFYSKYFQVKAVSSIAINCQSPVRANSDKLQTFPLGMNVLFAVTLHDNIGRRFAVATIPLKYRLNRQVLFHFIEA